MTKVILAQRKPLSVIATDRPSIAFDTSPARPQANSGSCPHCGSHGELLLCTKCCHVHGRCCGLRCCNGCGGSSMHGF